MFLLSTNLPDRKKVVHALSSIFGIGLNQSSLICKKLGWSNNIKIFELTEIQKLKLVRLIENSSLIITSDLKRALKTFKNNLVSIRSYRGIRSKQGFPIRGQRTHTNGKNAKKFKGKAY
jgi:small subunit ribosomal protein S13